MAQGELLREALVARLRRRHQPKPCSLASFDWFTLSETRQMNEVAALERAGGKPGKAAKQKSPCCSEEYLVRHGDPVIIRHCTVVTFADTRPKCCFQPLPSKIGPLWWLESVGIYHPFPRTFCGNASAAITSWHRSSTSC